MVDVGKPCPVCENGKMYPKGFREYKEPADKSEFYAKTIMICDKCGYEESNIVAGKNE